MINVSTTELMREVDRHMTEDIGIPSAVLMENAAQAVTNAVMSCGRSGRCAILIGPGNNGGDGLCVLRLLAQSGREAVGILLCDPSGFSGDALVNFKIAKRLGLSLTDSLEHIERADIIVDAVFGTGLAREITGKPLEAILRANASSAYRIAVDIPSGISGTSGSLYGAAFHADETVTFAAYKRGLLLTRELESVGRVTVAQIGMTDEAHLHDLEREQLIDFEFVDSLLPERKRCSNKGSFGRSLIIGASAGMPGAAVMASSACIRAGSGLTRALVPDNAVSAFASLPEAMVLSDAHADIAEQLDWADAVCIGCGMGNDENALIKLEKTLSSNKKCVLDADALNVISRERGLLSRLNENHIVTPHPGEMARLIGKTTDEITGDPVAAARGFAEKYGCTVVLKNAVSIIASSDGRLRYNASGNSGLAKGGSGDCLAGIITALAAQGLSLFDAASAGAFLLGTSAENALLLLKTRALTASDTLFALKSLSKE